jgi:hypothetical protein
VIQIPAAEGGDAAADAATSELNFFARLLYSRIAIAARAAASSLAAADAAFTLVVGSMFCKFKFKFAAFCAA